MVRFRMIWRESKFEHVWLQHACCQTYMLTQRNPDEIRTPAHGNRISHNRPLRHLCCLPAVFFHQLVLIVLTRVSGDFIFCTTEFTSTWTPVGPVFRRITAGATFSHETWYICVQVTQHNKNRRILGKPYQSGNNPLDFINPPSSYYDHIIVQQNQFPSSFVH
jgi:hypothetical protein